jgi:hypothetical protein
VRSAAVRFSSSGARNNYRARVFDVRKQCSDACNFSNLGNQHGGLDPAYRVTNSGGEVSIRWLFGLHEPGRGSIQQEV